MKVSVFRIYCSFLYDDEVLMLKDNKEYNFLEQTSDLQDSAILSYDYAEAIYDVDDVTDSSTSSSFLFSTSQKIFISVMILYSIAQAIFGFNTFIIILYIIINSTYIIMIMLKLYLSAIGYLISKSECSDDVVLEDKELPSYSILIPLYKEESIVDQLITHMKKIDYPEDILKIFIVLEEDDILTQKAFKNANLPKNFRLIIVPDSSPKTKPKACNYAMKFVDTDFVVIYDAEDIPHPKQLRDVVNAFKRYDESTVCIQCQLSWYNSDENWLSALFDIEYKILFEYILPALDYLGLPIPLGGTSNHIRVDKLKKLGYWDPYNVAEDAELGIRLYRHGFKTRVIKSYTHEESPINFITWIKQRTRWIKGYFQTCISHTRDSSLIKDIGLYKSLFFISLVGLSSLSYVFAGVSFVMLFIQYMNPDFIKYDVLGKISSIVLYSGIISILWHGYIARKGVYSLKGKSTKLWWTYPCYFILHVIASFRSIYQLVVAEHLWEKTVHSISKPSLD